MTPDQEIISLTQKIPRYEWWNSVLGITTILLGVIVALLAIASFIVGNKLGDLEKRKNFLENQILRDYQAPRKLTSLQKDQLIKELKKVKSAEVLIMAANLDDEGLAYRDQILDVFQKAGIKYFPNGGTYGTEIVGVTVSVYDLNTAPEFARDIVSAFKVADVPLNFTDYWKSQKVQIIVGNKPRIQN